jgi:hypothetical protein
MGCAIRLTSAPILASIVILGFAADNARGQAASSLQAGTRRVLSGAWALNAALSDPAEADDTAEASLVLTMGRQEVTFYERDGSRQIYQLSGRRERRDLGSGPVWTTATWDGTTLRLKIEGVRGLRILQVFAIDEQTGRLIVITSPDPDRQPVNTLRLVYDPLIDRSP